MTATPEDRQDRLAEANALRAQIRKLIKEIDRPRRERDLRRGRVKPRNRAEMAIFAKDLLKPRPADPDTTGK